MISVIIYVNLHKSIAILLFMGTKEIAKIFLFAILIGL